MRSRRAGFCPVCAMLLFSSASADAQSSWSPPGAVIERDKVELCGRVYLSSPPPVRKAASSIPALVAAKKWEEAARAIQVLLDAKHNDVIVRQASEEKQKEWIGANAAGQQWLSELPMEGLMAYRKAFGNAAAQLLEKAIKANRSELLAEVIARYPLTDAAANARKLAVSPIVKAPVLAPLAAKLPVLDSPIWRRSTMGDPVVDKEAKSWIDRILKGVSDAPLIPGAVPLTRDHLVIFRSYRDCAAITLREKQDPFFGGKVVRGDFWWRSVDLDGSPTILLRDGDLRVAFWTNTYLTSRDGGLLLENQFLGAIAAGGKHVYAVDELALLPTGNQLRFPTREMPEYARTYLIQNNVLAFELKTGKVVWRIGSSVLDARLGARAWPIGKQPLPEEDDFSRCHFLGVPLWLDPQLLFANEKNDGELRLIWVDPLKIGSLHRPSVRSVKALGVVYADERHLVNLRRRLTPVHLAAAENILICSTHAGAVLAVDLLTHRLLWGYGYGYRTETPAPKRPPVIDLQALPTLHWKACSPFLHAGKVVFTAPDDPHVHCLNLRDGRLVWKVRRTDDDVYLAGVFGDRALLVGKSHCRALARKDGKVLWTLETGTPSGLGAGNAETYFLPLSKGAVSKRPEVCAIDLVGGRISGRSESRKDEIPGNLVFHDGLVLSQTVTAIAAYPQKE